MPVAQPILLKVSRDLAYKLQDPVTLGSDNGQRLTADARLGYVVRAYRRLSRMVITLHPAMIEKLFHRYYTVVVTTSDDNGQVDFTEVQTVHDVYTRQPGTEEWDNTDYWSPADFLDIKMGINKFYTPDITTNRVYWTLMDDKINIVPAVKYEITYSGNKDVASLMETQSMDLDMPLEHTDLLLSLAAAEAYLDLGQQDMVSLYKGDFTEQFNLLVGKTKEKKQEDEEDEND